ncbi:hypothetical protein IMG5_202030 [Ichthyophthirius multifiliis]|uniref:Uncharacterized protein n=1 Tax=Ichthyophthirius multifiliis TaxID=5932 RepID=G0R620_ICHMU|nr:hypothetical protein IMG5_202030 [Ichthyophthirius multifiliis]EGR27086.1 hypothetical protein IMG5_202030 [Ichthyophthirius multifiliis]|eukprot:XP_004023970.1 hypothetical protein IMG5_202030 [Ichthyophthirius multifiliis]
MIKCAQKTCYKYFHFNCIYQQKLTILKMRNRKSEMNMFKILCHEHKNEEKCKIIIYKKKKKKSIKIYYYMGKI